MDISFLKGVTYNRSFNRLLKFPRVYKNKKNLTFIGNIRYLN